MTLQSKKNVCEVPGLCNKDWKRIMVDVSCVSLSHASVLMKTNRHKHIVLLVS